MFMLGFTNFTNNPFLHCIMNSKLLLIKEINFSY